MYFTNVHTSETFIEVSRLDGTSRTVLVNTQEDSPRSMAVNPIKRWVQQIIFFLFTEHSQVTPGLPMLQSYSSNIYTFFNHKIDSGTSFLYADIQNIALKIKCQVVQ